MKISIVKTKEKLESIREYLRVKYPYSLESLGKAVGYEMPALNSPFPKLSALLETSVYPLKFLGFHYYVHTEYKNLERLVPASEYFKLAFRSIADDVFSLNQSSARILDLQLRLRNAYTASGTRDPNSGHMFFSASTFVYSLKSELASFIFFSRSLLDTVATLMHFFYGPKSHQHDSFNDFTKNENKEGKKDPEMRDYLEKNLDWFKQLKDIRDYGTHYKAFDIGIYEQESGGIKLYLEDRFEIDLLINSVHVGIESLLQFIDKYFFDRISKI